MEATRDHAGPPTIVGRYAVGEEIASGGMATIHLGRLLGPVGFSRTVAIKKLHPQLAKDPEFTAMFLDEARLAARVRHPNVVPTLDVVAEEGELFLVMEYVHGESLANLMRHLHRRGERLPVSIAVTIVAGALEGLHAAHEATNERGEPLGIVHRDMSPQNVLVGTDGIPRVLDFGVAKAMGRLHTTREGQVKGKLAYMAPEQIRGAAVNRQTDVFAASVVLWNALVGKKLFDGGNEGELLYQVLEQRIPAPGSLVGDLPRSLDPIVLRGLERTPARRFATAHEMALALEQTGLCVPHRELGEWVAQVAAERLARRARMVSQVEIHPSHLASDTPPVSTSTRASLGRSVPDPEPSVPMATVSESLPALRTRKKTAVALSGLAALAVGALGGWWALRPATPPPVAPASAVIQPEPSPSTSAAPEPAAPPEPAASAVLPVTASAAATPARSVVPTPRAAPIRKVAPRPSSGPGSSCPECKRM